MKVGARAFALGTLATLVACEESSAPPAKEPHPEIAASAVPIAISPPPPPASASAAPAPSAIASATPIAPAPIESASSAPPSTPPPDGVSMALMIARAVKHATAATAPAASPSTGIFATPTPPPLPQGGINTAGPRSPRSGSSCGAIARTSCGAPIERQTCSVGKPIRAVDLGLAPRERLSAEDHARAATAIANARLSVKRCAQAQLNQIGDMPPITAKVKVARTDPRFTVDSPYPQLSTCIARALDTRLVVDDAAPSAFQIAIDAGD